MNEKLFVGLDVDLPSLEDSNEGNKVCGDIITLPFGDSSFDVVSANMVFEHLGDPIAALREANRVLDDKGILILHTACSRHYMLLAGRLLSRALPRKTFVNLVSAYTGRKREDIFPTRYRANTARKLSSVALDAGFIGGFVSYLETPLDFPSVLQNFEQRMRTLVPKSLKSTLLAIYIARRY